MRLFLPALTLLALAGCTAAPKPRPAPPAAPVVVPLPAPVPLGSDWRDWPLTPGDWRYERTQFGSRATFGTTVSQVTLSCDNDRNVRLSVSRAVAGVATIRTSSTLRTLSLAETGHPPASGGLATFAASDPILDAMGFSRGRFVIEQAGAAPLVIPAYPEILRVAEDCRG